MKLHKKDYTILILFFSVAITLFYLFHNEDVEISDIKWKCKHEGDNCICFVSFNIENTTKVVLFPKVHIRAQYVTSGKRATVKIVGEKTIDLEVGPNRTLDVEERLEVKRTPTMVLVNELSNN